MLVIIFQFNPQITVLCDNNFLAEIKKILFYYPVKKNPLPPPKKMWLHHKKKVHCHRFQYFWMCAGLDIYKGIITNQPHRSWSFDLVSLFLTSDLGTQSHSPALVSCSPFPVTTVVTFVIIQSKTILFLKFWLNKTIVKKNIAFLNKMLTHYLC